MRMVAINGSPHGKRGATGAMLSALMDGFQSNGGRGASIELAEKEIRQCRGCYACWSKTPGICAQDDDMRGIIEAMKGANLLIFGSPLYFNNVSGTLKTFFDRLTAAGGDPHAAQAGDPAAPNPGYIMVSNCGFPTRSQFYIVSLWINRVAQMSRARLVGEHYVAGGRALTAPAAQQAPARDRYLGYLRACGASYAATGALNEELAASVDKDLLAF